MKEKINIIKRKNILILLFLNIIIISLILSMITKIEVKQINIGIVKKELNTNVDIEKIWDSSRLIKQNIKNNNDNNNNNGNNNNNNNNGNKFEVEEEQNSGRIGNSGKLFKTKQEADNYADKQVLSGKNINGYWLLKVKRNGVWYWSIDFY